MPLPLPGSLTPSKVTAFRECAFAFRLSAIDKIPQPANVWTLRGTLAHAVLERLYFDLPQGQRTVTAARRIFDHFWPHFVARDEFTELLASLRAEEIEQLRESSFRMVENDFKVEDPNRVQVLGTELLLETMSKGVRLRGIIDRLDRNDDGTITVTDYKTGRMPSEGREHDKLIGVHFYAMLCEAVLGVRPKSVQLHYLKSAASIVTHPTPQSSKALLAQTGAIWRAVEHACDREDFRPRPSRLCGYCAYRELCPANAERTVADGSSMP
jgi:putative RecB family exonuclease